MDDDLTLDLDVLRRWIGRTETITDMLDPAQAIRLSHALDRPASFDVGTPMPPLWHWAYFPRSVPTSDLGSDGHEQRGRLIPPVELPRRMWAGGRVRFHGQIPLGTQAERTSTVVGVDVKEGRSGSLCIVTLGHTVSVHGETRLTEEQDLVYAQRLRPPAESAPAPQHAEWSAVVRPDEVLLFRYSALTFNGHRIHYDRRYCIEVEGYPGLVVHGPLVATMLAGLLDRPLRSFAFRAVAPLFDTSSFTINGRPSRSGAALWAAGSDGRLAVTADATW